MRADSKLERWFVLLSGPDCGNGVALEAADPGVPGIAGTITCRASVDGAARSTSIASAKPPRVAASKILPRGRSTPRRSRTRLSSWAAAKL